MKRSTQSRTACLEALESRTLLTAFYVSPSGSDGNPGTSGSPWATLQHAVDSVLPGDNIEVQTGTYVGCKIQNSGTAGAPITLEAAPGAQVLVNAPGPNNIRGSIIEVEYHFAENTISYWTFKGLEVANAPTNAGFDIRNTDHVTVQNCYSHNNHNWGIFMAFSYNQLITQNHCSYNTMQHGIYNSNSGDNGVFTYNELDHNGGCGIHSNGDRSQGGDGIISNVLIANNIIHDNGAPYGGAGINCDGVINSTIQNNLLYNNHAGGITLYKTDGAVASNNIVMVNNTIVQATDGRNGVQITGGANNKLYNNIIVQQNTSSLRGCIVIDRAAQTGFVSDYNAFAGNTRFSTDGKKFISGLPAWQSAIGQDTHSLTSTTSALFVNATGNDYHLKAGSPAINAGTSTSAPSIDLEGNPRPHGTAFDIGCYEYLLA